MARSSQFCKTDSRRIARDAPPKQTPQPEQKRPTPIHPPSVLSADEMAAGSSLGRRATVRRLSSRRAVAQPRAFAAGPLWEVTIINFSTGGIGLRLDSRWRKGTVLQIDLPEPEFPRSLLARVVHVKQDGQHWVHGCKLLTVLTKDEFEALLS